MRYIDWIAFKYRMRTEYIPIFAQFDTLFHFDSYADLDATPTIPVSLVGNPYFESEFGADAIQAIAVDFQQLEYFDLALNMDVHIPSALDGVVLDYISGSVEATSVYVHNIKLNELTQYEAQLDLTASYMSETYINVISYFEDIVTLEQFTCYAISLENSTMYTISADITAVGVYEVGFTQTDMFTSFLEIVPVYIYMLEPNNTVFSIASITSLEKVEQYHAISGSLQNNLAASLYLDSAELVEDAYILTSHFEHSIIITCFTASQIAILAEMQTSQEMNIDLLLEHPALGVDSNVLHFSSNAALEYITHTYLSFNSEVLSMTGAVATMFLMRDRYINDEEFFDLSIESFEDLTIENLLEVEI